MVVNFVGHASEVTTLLNFYHLILGLLVPSITNDWQRRVGAGWVFGTMTFFAAGAFETMDILA